MHSNQSPPIVPQLILTVAEGQAHLESSDALLVTSPHPAGDTEAVLAAIGHWLFQARRAAAGEG
jgi:hypothetical protein